MGQAAEIITSLASLLWPVVVGFLIIFLLPTLRTWLGQSESIDVEVGGTKVSLQRASEDLQKLIADLQDRVNQLEAATEGAPPAIGVDAEGRGLLPSVLWVDDRPEANVYERARLRDAGYRVVQAGSTTTALNAFRSQGPFDVVVSDMARIEAGGTLNTTAGIDLWEQIRAADDRTPVVFYSSSRSLAPVRSRLDAAETVQYTTSPTELMRLLGVIDR